MRLSIVLPGGGACGRWQIGVLKYLYDMQLFPKINLVCGTSVGGLNTLLLAKYWFDFNKACDMWAGIKSNKDIFKGMLQFNGVFDIMGMIGQLFFTNKGKSLLDPVGLYQTIDRTFGNDKLSDLLVPVMITTTDLMSGERVVIDSATCPEYKVSEIAKATSAIPIAFPAVDYYIDNNKDLCVDGGLGRNNPVALAIESGSSHIILIGTSPDAYPRKEVKNNVIDIAMRCQDIIMHAFEEDAWDEKKDYEDKMALDSNLLPIKFLDIYPDASTGSALEFGNVEQFAAGYRYAKDNYPAEILEAFLG